ncbi:unnamed protein product [Adineta steineri]|uniref:SCP domain-containing protein n=1 Tax=Adineta steineri TaxID=433720 RepID=A0A818TRK7_9BILA|nr:unnamed protein product [Adineta steineri]CAF0958534.1 unnamed protein product [Adineta steineri]CAF3686896.1 unnamed protein product [Adineta steineri]CAF3811694.1 unnamed protein product [Adineta steineri]
MFYIFFNIILTIRMPWISWDKKLFKLLTRVLTQDRENEKKPARKARHRYERPSALRIEMNTPHHRAHGQIKESVDSPQAMYTKVLADLLQSHNYYRARHSAQPLTVSQRLNLIAQKYAEYLAATSKFEHSRNKLGDDLLGENLYMQWISQGKVPVSGREAAKNWYDEIALYNFKHPRYSEDTGHFTQMIWQSTQRMGVGVALSRDGREVYIVTNYYPVGNIINHGYFEKNVLPAKY